MDRPILIAELGSGGMADVFLAVRRGKGGFVKLVVLKQLRLDAMDAEAVTMFGDEARISARLNHPNVVQTEGADFDGEHFRLEMEFLDGQPLNRIVQRVKRSGIKFPHDVVVAIVRDVLAGLHYAHELTDYDGSPFGVVHRDVSPQNIFVTYDGRVKVVDFGIAKTAGQAAVTRIGVVKGKTRYMAPEQALRAVGRDIDRRADVFGTGIVLWQLLTGKKYWAEASELEIYERLVKNGLPPSPRAIDPTIPEALDAVCARALAHDPADRFQTAEEFQHALEDAIQTSDRDARRWIVDTLANLFADKREALRAVIEKAITRTPEGDKVAENVEPTKLFWSSSSPSLSMPAIPWPPADATTTPPPPSVRTGRITHEPPPPSGRTQRSAVDVPRSVRPAVEPPVVLTDPPAAAPATPKRSWHGPALVAALVAVSAAVFVAALVPPPVSTPGSAGGAPSRTELRIVRGAHAENPSQTSSVTAATYSARGPAPSSSADAGAPR